MKRNSICANKRLRSDLIRATPVFKTFTTLLGNHFLRLEKEMRRTGEDGGKKEKKTWLKLLGNKEELMAHESEAYRFDTHTGLDDLIEWSPTKRDVSFISNCVSNFMKR